MEGQGRGLGRRAVEGGGQLPVDFSSETLSIKKILRHLLIQPFFFNLVVL